MEGDFVSYSVDNDRVFRNALSDAYRQVGDLSIPLKLIGQDFYRSEKAIFQLSGPGAYPDLGGLHPTEKSIRRAKAAKMRKVGFIYPLLKASGRLAASVTDPSDSDAIFNVDSGGSRLTIGTKVAYGVFHQSDDPRRKIPQRKFLFIGPESTFATSEQQGRTERWVSILKGFVAAKLSTLGKAA